jgi:hypothetical protein
VARHAEPGGLFTSGYATHPIDEYPESMPNSDVQWGTPAQQLSRDSGLLLQGGLNIVTDGAL